MAELVVRSPPQKPWHIPGGMSSPTFWSQAPGVAVELHCLDLHADDVLLLCSDGLDGMTFTEAQIAEFWRSSTPDPQRACERLMEEAKVSGGKDNIFTVIVTRVQSTPATSHA